MASFTCLSCHVAFADGDGQRDHFRSDWHRYNLKRKVSDLPPVSREVYNEKVVAVQDQCAKAKAEAEAQKPYCKPCKKTFGTKMAYDNHINSKKHIQKTIAHAEDFENRKNTKITEKVVEEEDEDDEDMEVEEVDSDEWGEDEVEGEPVPLNECFFCNTECETVEDKLQHMVSQHRFFVPDLEYCTDVAELMTYLGWKVGVGFECLVCQWKARRNPSLKSTRQHMLDKEHCRIELSGDKLLEYGDFYDFSSSYPDADTANPDEEVELNVITGDDSELVLPSGAVIGHRSLRRYYKQNLKPYHKDGAKRKRGSAFHSILANYRALGWIGVSGVEAQKKFRDIKFAQKARNTYQMKLGVKANKLQHHFRCQNPI